MNDATYWICSGSEPVTDAAETTITDPQIAKELAAEVSMGQPGTIVSVVSRKSETGGEWTGTLARFQDGEEIPWCWRVDFLGGLLDVDHVHLNKAAIFYESRRNEVGLGGEIQLGRRHVVTLEASDGDAAIAKVQDALGAKARECSDWHVDPAR